MTSLGAPVNATVSPEKERKVLAKKLAANWVKAVAVLSIARG